MNDRIEQFLQQAKQFLPTDSVGKELEKNLRALANSSFNKLDLVGREEFEAQTAVLARTREKIEALEKQFDELSHQLNSPQ